MRRLWHTWTFSNYSHWFRHTFLLFDPKQKAVCIIPTSLHVQTIITAVSAKRCRLRHKSGRSPLCNMNPHSDRLCHLEVTGNHQTTARPRCRPPRWRHCSSLFATHLGDIISFLLAVSMRQRSGSGCRLVSDSHTVSDVVSLQTGWSCRGWTLEIWQSSASCGKSEGRNSTCGQRVFISNTDELSHRSRIMQLAPS